MVAPAQQPLPAYARLILLIEDNPGDAELVKEALLEIQADLRLDIAGDGEDGLRRLAAMTAAGRLPDLIILNINLPRMSGPEVLVRLRADPVLARIPVVMLTSSNLDSDRAACLGVVDYLIKAHSWTDTIRIARKIVGLLGLPSDSLSAG